MRDHKTGIFFLNKCLELSLLLSDKKGEMAACHRLGKAYECIQEMSTAIQYHEKHKAIAELTALGDEEGLYFPLQLTLSLFPLSSFLSL